MNLSEQRILIFSGPSGGHLFPAQAFAEAVSDAVWDIRLVLVTSVRAKGLCEKFPPNLFTDIVYLPEFGLPAGFSLGALKLVFSLPSAIIQSWQLISRIRPSLCIGFGSFVSYFGMLFAAWRGIPTLIHEQNQVPGKATRMLRNVVKQIAISFPNTTIQGKLSQLKLTGLPIRKELRENIALMDQKPTHPFMVLVCGGSQGSVFLNAAVLKAFSLFSAEERAQFAVIHITGLGQDEKVSGGYAQLGIPAEVYPFFEKMQLVYNRSHLAVSRAGANSAFEQALYGIPTVFIPYPHAEGHQNENAGYFVKQGAAVMYSQNNQTAENIAGLLREWVLRPQAYRTAVKQMRGLSQTDGHARLLKIAQDMLRSKISIQKL